MYLPTEWARLMWRKRSMRRSRQVKWIRLMWRRRQPWRLLTRWNRLMWRMLLVSWHRKRQQTRRMGSMRRRCRRRRMLTSDHNRPLSASGPASALRPEDAAFPGIVFCSYHPPCGTCVMDGCFLSYPLHRQGTVTESPMGACKPRGGRSAPLRTPELHGLDDGMQAAALFRQGIFHGGWNGRIRGARDHALLLKFLQPLGERLRADPDE